MSGADVNKSKVLLGAIAGALLTPPLIAGFFLGWKLFGLPFAPFDVFDRLARVLPGRVVTFGIDSMVQIIRWLNLGRTDTVAKNAEQTIAVVIFLAGGIIAAATLFAVLRWMKKSALMGGSVWGTIIGAAVLLIGQERMTTNPVLGGIWTLVMFLLWGKLLGWVYQRLTAEAPTAEDGDGSVKRVDRRTFLLRLGGATAAITVVGSVLGAIARNRRQEGQTAVKWSARHALPNAGAPVKPVAGTRPEFTPLEKHYRIDIDTIPPAIDENSWRLKFNGLVEQPQKMTLGQIRDYAPIHQFITLECISNPVAGDLISTTRWTGTSMQRMLPDLKLKPGATHLKIKSADGFFETVALEKIKHDERVMLCYAWDGVPLPTKHGFPLRIYVPDVYGMKQPKWIESIEGIDHWEPGYWVERGWSREAQINITSVIDTIAIQEKTTDARGRNVVPIGGIAFAGARGISKVEVRMDDGQWHEAELRTPLSEKTWVVWRCDCPAQTGEHRFTVRCYDGNGKMQVVEPSPSYPDGATGLYSKSATL
jgi:DMSO/TMAO reductase YedYZ molybdopterin-dependent catalytic subunit